MVIRFASHFQCSYSQHSKHVGTEGGGTRNIALRGDGASRWACGARPVCWLHQKVPGDVKSQDGRLAGKSAQCDRQWSHPGGVRVRTGFKEEDTQGLWPPVTSARLRKGMGHPCDGATMRGQTSATLSEAKDEWYSTDSTAEGERLPLQPCSAHFLWTPGLRPDTSSSR